MQQSNSMNIDTGILINQRKIVQKHEKFAKRLTQFENKWYTCQTSKHQSSTLIKKRLSNSMTIDTGILRNQKEIAQKHEKFAERLTQFENEWYTCQTSKH